MENHCIIYPSWPVHGFEARQSAALSFSPDIYSARQSGPINFPDYIEPIVTRPTSTARWIYPQGCSSSSSTSPPPLFKFNFSAECIESTLPPERHLVSFSFSSFSSFFESLSPHPLREEIFVFRSTPVFSYFSFGCWRRNSFVSNSITRSDIAELVTFLGYLKKLWQVDERHLRDQNQNRSNSKGFVRKRVQPR